MKDEYGNEQRPSINDFMNSLVPAVIAFSLLGGIIGLILGGMVEPIKGDYGFNALQAGWKLGCASAEMGIALGISFPFIRKLSKFYLILIQVGVALTTVFVDAFSGPSIKFANKAQLSNQIILMVILLPIIGDPIVFWLVNNKKKISANDQDIQNRRLD